MPETREASPVEKDACETTRREEWEVLEVGLPAFLIGLINLGLLVRQVDIPGFPLEQQDNYRGSDRAGDPYRTRRGTASEGYDYASGRTTSASFFSRRRQCSIPFVSDNSSAGFHNPESSLGLPTSSTTGYLRASFELWLAARRKAQTARDDSAECLGGRTGAEWRGRKGYLV